MCIRSLKSGVVYFTLVFTAGFALGILRVIWLVPRVGTRVAELTETPAMLLVIVLAARWIVRRFGSNCSKSEWLFAGFFALALLLIAELALVVAIRGLTIAEYVVNRDPISGTVYIISLGIFAIMPALFAGR